MPSIGHIFAKGENISAHGEALTHTRALTSLAVGDGSESGNTSSVFLPAAKIHLPLKGKAPPSIGNYTPLVTNKTRLRLAVTGAFFYAFSLFFPVDLRVTKSEDTVTFSRSIKY